jgi:NDP-sugar pyrophosphorylase family protein
MDVKAIILVGPQAGESGPGWNALGGAPLASVDVLGQSVLQRITERLLRHGVNSVHVVGDIGAHHINTLRGGPPGSIHLVRASGPQVWRSAETIFSDAAQAGTELMLVLRLGAYVELDYDHLIQFHLDQHNRVTTVHNADGQSLDVFCISASRRNDAAYLFRHQLAESRTPSTSYGFAGYWNPLSSGADLRRLTMDAFNGVAGILPVGREIKPGVWLGAGARIHRTARVLAPAFIGSHTRVRASAVVTRFSAVEHHCEVDCGSVIEDSNVLPFTRIGAGLDVAHALVGNRHLLHLQRNTEVEISDPKLVNAVPVHAPLRALSSAAGLVAFLPGQVLRGIFPSSQRECPASLSAAVKAPSAALKSPTAVETPGHTQPEAQFPANLIVARRYGNE